ncbi:hypothetical protein EIK77_010054 [Talaromyces pinophilus]|nr:hypothetical protein EIK77_010054 [Talaromyces pinophilus]PCG96975.1 Zinc finger, C6HC-type [Penicillium occitanis (nom. inval.)]PCH00806.1 hypothetical protein PENOC_051350 [Penicillium occitanis (nom. inval.)]
MDTSRDQDMALRFMLEDLAELENQQKGKQRADESTDREMAIKAMKNEIHAARRFLQDRMLAARVGTAAHDETPNDDAASDNSNELSFDHTDNDGPIIIDLTEEQDTADAFQDPEIAPTKPTPSCDSCLEQRQILLTKSCNHSYCHICIRDLFLGAMRDEELYPPRCCAEPFPAEIASQVLNNKELENFNQKATEYTAKKRVYCAEPGCSSFIPQSSIQGDIGKCPGCQKETHLPCGALVHPGVDCPLDSTLQNVLSMANTQGWQRCYGCRATVELYHGCNHMTCR